MDTGGYPSELPHSVILGSRAMCAYPKLIAAYHDLLRLLMPRHPPCTLYSLIFKVTLRRLRLREKRTLLCFFSICSFQRTPEGEPSLVEIVSWSLTGPEVLSKLNRIRIVQPKRWWKASMLKAWGCFRVQKD